MNIQSLYPKRPFVLINDSGYYFDEVNAELKDVIKYPDYDYLLKNIDELKESNKVIILYPSQKKEIELMSVYLPVAETPVKMNHIAGRFLMNLKKYDEKEILELAGKKDRYKWLSLFVFGRLHKQLNLNPSYTMTEPLINIWKYYDLKNIALLSVDQYVNSNEEFEPVIFLELAAAEFLGKETEESRSVKKLLSYDIGEEITPDKLELTENLYENLMKAGLIYETGEGKIVKV